MTPATDLFSAVSPEVRRLLGAGAPEVRRAHDEFPDARHRTVLEYWWDEALPPLTVIGQNPSRATRRRGDPTVTRCARRAYAMGLGGLVMLNMFSLVETIPALMWAEPTDPALYRDNLARVEAAIIAHPSAPLLYAPGGDRERRHRAAMLDVEALCARLGRDLMCIGTTADGSPRHPSRAAYAAGMTRWTREGARR